MPQYGEATYWDERYTREPGMFEWYQGYTGLKEILQKHVSTTADILHVGVGTSRLQEDMVRQGGYKGVVNVDSSSVAIDLLMEMHKSLPQLVYKVADCRNMPEFLDGLFDVILDKGTLDAMLCSEDASSSVNMMMTECHRVLRPGGTMIIVTYGDPLSRLIYFVGSGFPEWHDIQVYCIVKLEQMSSGSESAVLEEHSIVPVIKGPFPCMNVDAMDALSNREGVHYAYILSKES